MYRVLDLFSGIGGFSLGLELIGFKTVAFCEIDPYCRKVLGKHWPGVPCFVDVKQLSKKELNSEGVKPNIIVGGYPCQGFSVAGQRRGNRDDRYLWPEAIRLVREIRPAWCIFENVVGHISLGLDQTLYDLENEGYATRAYVIPACAIDTPHRRDRVWIVARTLSHSHNTGCNKQRWPITTQAEYKTPERGCRWSPEPPVGRVVYGLPKRVDRIRSLGNAIIPWIATILGGAIMEQDA